MYERLEVLFKSLWAKYKSKPIRLLFWLGVFFFTVTLVTVAVFIADLPYEEMWVPFLCGIALAAGITYYRMLSLASRIFTNWYGASSIDAFDIIVSHVLGSGYPKLKASRGRLDLDEKPEDERRKIKTKMDAGVPVILTVDGDTAVMTEFGGKPYGRYTKPGQYTLLPFEQIRYTIDRRSRGTMKQGIVALTRDGIHVSLDVSVGYQIIRKGSPSLDELYPVDETALYAATYNRVVFANNPEPTRLDQLMPELLPAPVRNVVAQYRLSDLFEHSIEGLTEVPRARLSNEIAAQLRGFVGSIGLEITFVNIAEIKIDEGDKEVRQHMIEHWRREREEEIERRVGPTQARVKADQVMTMLKSLDMLKEGEEFTTEKLWTVVGEIRDLYYILSDIAALARGEEGGLSGYGGGPWTPQGIEQRRQRYQEYYRMFQAIEQGRLDEPGERTEDMSIVRRFPPDMVRLD